MTYIFKYGVCNRLGTFYLFDFFQFVCGCVCVKLGCAGISCSALRGAAGVAGQDHARIARERVRRVAGDRRATRRVADGRLRRALRVLRQLRTRHVQQRHVDADAQLSTRALQTSAKAAEKWHGNRTQNGARYESTLQV